MRSPEYGGAEGITFVYGDANVVAEGRVEITSRSGERWQASADDVVLSTGSSPRRIKIAGLPPERTLTNEELFELPEPPRHLTIVGGGPIGLEMAVAFRRLGSSGHRC